MKYLLIICMLAAACSSARKSINQQKQEAHKSSTIILDSSGKKSLDTGGVAWSGGFVKVVVDSGYDKVTEEEVKEVIDSNVIHRETKRVIKEKGQKKTEQSSVTIQKDSSAKHVQEQTAVKQVQKQDSSAVTVTKNKQVKRVTLLPWWVWVIAAVVLVGIAWWKKNSIIDLFI